MRYIRTMLCAVAAFFVIIPNLRACDDYTSIPKDEIKVLRDVLLSKDADPLDRLFAYEELACSDRVILRDHAIRVGLENAKDPLVRQQIAFNAMMSKARIDLEFAPDGKTSKENKAYLKTIGGVFMRDVQFRSRSRGCLSLYGGRNCDPVYMIEIKGSKIFYNYNKLRGVLELQDNNEYIGFIKHNGSRIPARIRLY